MIGVDIFVDYLVMILLFFTDEKWCSDSPTDDVCRTTPRATGDECNYILLLINNKITL